MEIKVIDNGLILKNIEDFNATHIFECGQCFRWGKEPDDSYTGVAFGKVINVKSWEEKKEVRILNTTIQEFYDIWFEYFDLGRDYGDIKRKLSEDMVMRKAIEYGSGIRILKQDPWEILLSFIISANNRIPMIARSIGLLSQMYGKPIEYNGKTYYSFPTIEELAKAELEDISKCRAGFRCKYIFEAVKMVSEGIIDLDYIKSLEEDEARKELMRVPGVGAKVADCIMLFSMEKYGTYPVDVWIKRITEYFYLHKDVSIKEIRQFARDKFGTLAGFAQQYLFYYAREMKIGSKKGEKNMILLGAAANALGIFAGGIIGIFMKKGLPKRFGDSVMYALGLFTFGLGITFFIKSEEVMVLILSLVLGTLIGELIDIEKRLENLGNSLQSRFKGAKGRFTEGFVTASLLFCVGSMAIMGSLQSGLTGNHQVLFAKTVMDTVAAIIFAAAMGFGVALSSVPVLLYEGGLTLAASAVAPYLGDAVVNEMTAVGGVLLIGLALSVLDIKKVRVGNMLPGIFLPIILMLFI